MTSVEYLKVLEKIAPGLSFGVDLSQPTIICAFDWSPNVNPVGCWDLLELHASRDIPALVAKRLEEYRDQKNTTD